jgi:hypothetical protein
MVRCDTWAWWGAWWGVWYIVGCMVWCGALSGAWCGAVHGAVHGGEWGVDHLAVERVCNKAQRNTFCRVSTCTLARLQRLKAHCKAHDVLFAIAMSESALQLVHCAS